MIQKGAFSSYYLWDYLTPRNPEAFSGFELHNDRDKGKAI